MQMQLCREWQKSHDVRSQMGEVPYARQYAGYKGVGPDADVRRSICVKLGGGCSRQQQLFKEESVVSGKTVLRLSTNVKAYTLGS